MSKIQKTALQALVTFKSRDPLAFNANFEKLKALVSSLIIQFARKGGCLARPPIPHQVGSFDEFFAKYIVKMSSKTGILVLFIDVIIWIPYGKHIAYPNGGRTFSKAS